jgi:hypothetical protein
MREKTMVALTIGRSTALRLVAATALVAGLLEQAQGDEGRGGPSPSLGISEALGLGNLSVAEASRGREGTPRHMLGLPDWMTISANLDWGYRSTNFFESDHDTTLFLGDSRIEFWIPPWDRGLAWGPYIRAAGIASNRDPAWENAWLAGPGFGFQAYPFSHPWLYERSSLATRIFGPTRLFAERNHLDYLHPENAWRPESQTRAGADYWREIHVNEIDKWPWGEIWSGLFWQSSNEFDDDYESVIFANAVRAGVRLPNAGMLSLLTPYVLVESSLTDNPEYYWENKLVAGFGIRLTPSIPKENKHGGRNWLTRLVVYAEYLEVADYYRAEAPSGVPDHDFRAGISLSIGEWYREPVVH